jgi:hypothetical protein
MPPILRPERPKIGWRLAGAASRKHLMLPDGSVDRVLAQDEVSIAGEQKPHLTR